MYLTKIQNPKLGCEPLAISYQCTLTSEIFNFLLSRLVFPSSWLHHNSEVKQQALETGGDAASATIPRQPQDMPAQA